MGQVIKVDFRQPKRTQAKRPKTTTPKACNEKVENGVIVVGETEVLGSKPEKITLAPVLVWVAIVAAIVWKCGLVPWW